MVSKMCQIWYENILLVPVVPVVLLFLVVPDVLLVPVHVVPLVPMDLMVLLVPCGCSGSVHSSDLPGSSGLLGSDGSSYSW